MLKRLNSLISEHNEKSGDTLPVQAPSSESADYFFEKTRDLILDSEQKFKGESLENKCFFWLQGEQDAEQPKSLYKLYLSVLWEELKALGFTHFFCIRVGYWFNDGIAAIMLLPESWRYYLGNPAVAARTMELKNIFPGETPEEIIDSVRAFLTQLKVPEKLSAFPDLSKDLMERTALSAGENKMKLELAPRRVPLEQSRLILQDILLKSYGE